MGGFCRQSLWKRKREETKVFEGILSSIVVKKEKGGDQGIWGYFVVNRKRGKGRRPGCLRVFCRQSLWKRKRRRPRYLRVHQGVSIKLLFYFATKFVLVITRKSNSWTVFPLRSSKMFTVYMIIFFSSGGPSKVWSFSLKHAIQVSHITYQTASLR